jgi:REP element-mobilizing transposase RayT
MILAYHSTWSAYGFWLSNDPRGSWSDFVRSWDLYLMGAATKTSQRYSVAHHPFDRELRDVAQQALRYPAVRFKSDQIRMIASGIEHAVAESGYVLRSLAIMQDHVHTVIMRYPNRTIERIVGHLKTRAAQSLRDAGLNPMEQFADENGKIPSVWVQHGWNVYLNTDQEIERAVEYDEKNPMKSGLCPQRWSFVQRV